VKDVQTKNESNNFLSCMEKLNQKYNNFSENYKEGRKIVQSELFKNEELESFSASTNMAENDSSRKEKDKKNYYFIKKFDVLSYLVQI